MSEGPMMAIGLQKRYGEQLAIHWVDLDVPAGTVPSSSAPTARASRPPCASSPP